MIWDKYNDFTLGDKFYHRILKSSFLNLKFLLLTLVNYEITLMINIIININTKLYSFTKYGSLLLLLFLNSKLLF